MISYSASKTERLKAQQIILAEIEKGPGGTLDLTGLSSSFHDAVVAPNEGPFRLPASSSKMGIVN